MKGGKIGKEERGREGGRKTKGRSEGGRHKVERNGRTGDGRLKWEKEKGSDQHTACFFDIFLWLSTEWKLHILREA